MWSSWSFSPGEIFVVNERVEVGVEGREIIHALLYLVSFLPLPLPVGPRDLSDDGRHGSLLVFTRGKLSPSKTMSNQYLTPDQGTEYFDHCSFITNLIDKVVSKLKLHPDF